MDGTSRQGDGRASTSTRSARRSLGGGASRVS